MEDLNLFFVLGMIGCICFDVAVSRKIKNNGLVWSQFLIHSGLLILFFLVYLEKINLDTKGLIICTFVALVVSILIGIFSIRPKETNFFQYLSLLVSIVPLAWLTYIVAT